MIAIKVHKETTYRVLLKLIEAIRYNHLYEELEEMKKAEKLLDQ